MRCQLSNSLNPEALTRTSQNQSRQGGTHTPVPFSEATLCKYAALSFGIEQGRRGKQSRPGETTATKVSPRLNKGHGRFNWGETIFFSCFTGVSPCEAWVLLPVYSLAVPKSTRRNCNPYWHVITLCMGPALEVDDIGGKNGDGEQEKNSCGHGCQECFHGAFLLWK